MINKRTLSFLILALPIIGGYLTLCYLITRNTAPEQVNEQVNEQVQFYDAIRSMEGRDDCCVSDAALQDLRLAGYDVAAMTDAEIVDAYTGHWIKRKGYPDTIFNRAMIWRAGPNGPANKELYSYGRAVVRLVGDNEK